MQQLQLEGFMKNVNDKWEEATDLLRQVNNRYIREGFYANDLTQTVDSFHDHGKAMDEQDYEFLCKHLQECAKRLAKATDLIVEMVEEIKQ